MKYISIILFCVVTIMHLAYSLESDIKGRKDTKPLIVPSIILIYLSWNINALNKYLLIGLIFGFLGDYFLMSSRKKYSFLGAGAFAIGHIFYIKTFLDITGNQLQFRFSYIIVIALYAIYAFFVYKLIFTTMLEKEKKVKIIGAIVYIVIIAVMSLSAYTAVAAGISGMKIAYLGTIMFIISDTCYLYRANINRGKYINFIVMLTYISAQLLIVLGFIV